MDQEKNYTIEIFCSYHKYASLNIGADALDFCVEPFERLDVRVRAEDGRAIGDLQGFLITHDNVSAVGGYFAAIDSGDNHIFRTMRALLDAGISSKELEKDQADVCVTVLWVDSKYDKGSIEKMLVKHLPEMVAYKTGLKTRFAATATIGGREEELCISAGKAGWEKIQVSNKDGSASSVFYLDCTKEP